MGERGVTLALRPSVHVPLTIDEQEDCKVRFVPAEFLPLPLLFQGNAVNSVLLWAVASGLCSSPASGLTILTGAVCGV